MMPPISVCVTSYARPDLLERTLDSLYPHIKDMVTEWLIADNSGDPLIAELLERKYPFFDKKFLDYKEPGPYAHHSNCDTLYEAASQDCILHVEDDRLWTGDVANALREMADVLLFDSNVMIVQNHNQPGNPRTRPERSTQNRTKYYYLLPGWDHTKPPQQQNGTGLWNGWSWISGLRSKARFRDLMPFVQYEAEHIASRTFLDKKPNMRIAHLKTIGVEDIGGKRTTFDYEKLIKKQDMFDKPKVIVICPIYNEAHLIPSFVAHYKALNADIHFFDNYSTDGSPELAKALGCKVESFGDPHHFREDNNMEVRLNAWKQYKETHDLAIVVDADEFLCPLKPLSKNEAPITLTRGFNVSAEGFPDFRPLWLQPDFHKGVEYWPQHKAILWNIKKLNDVKFSAGMHQVLHSKPTIDLPTIYSEKEKRRVPCPAEDAPYLLHLRNVGHPEYAVKKNRERRERVPKEDLLKGTNTHYQHDDTMARNSWIGSLQTVSPIDVKVY